MCFYVRVFIVTSSLYRQYLCIHLYISSCLSQLFDYLANFIYKFLKDRNLLKTPDPLPLGFTFAFPCRRLDINRAILTRWTKSFHCVGVEGQEVVALLEKAIEKKGVCAICFLSCQFEH